jgi:hypothetical protein
VSRPLLRPDLSSLRGAGARGFRAVSTSRTVAMLGSMRRCEPGLACCAGLLLVNTKS